MGCTRRQALAAALAEVGNPGIAGGNATPSCGVCGDAIALSSPSPRGGPIVLLGCLDVHHDACFKLHCDGCKVRGSEPRASDALASRRNATGGGWAGCS